MEDTLFNINILSNILEKNKIEINRTNCYLFFLFFLERSQLVSNIIRIIDPSIKNTFSIGVKYCIINESKYDKIFRKVKEFKNDFDKNELINELIRFIKNTIDEKKVELIKMDTSPSKIKFLFNKFDSLKTLIDELDSFGVDDIEIHEYLHLMEEFDDIDLKRQHLKDELNDLDKSWEKNNKKNEIGLLFKNWL